MNQVTIKNQFLTLTVLDYGAIIQKLEVHHPHGKTTNVVVGFDDPEHYLSDDIFLGACIGRFAGRIHKDGFTLEGKHYTLNADYGFHLHGGKEGFGKKYWKITQVKEDKEPLITLTYLSEDMEEGYPGNLSAQVTYQLKQNGLHITHTATTDKTTIVNLTNHAYFKLDDADTVSHYNLQLQSEAFLETHPNSLPTGNRLSVQETSYDFLEEKKIDGLYFDTPFITEAASQKVARVSSELSGIALEVSSNQPAVIVYTPKDFAAICFETQNYPDAPNHASFPSSVLRPGETYNNTAVFKFGFVL